MIQKRDVSLGASRRRVVINAAAAMVGIASFGPITAHAQAQYPSKPIKLIVGFAAGGPTDIIGRIMGAKLSESLGQQVYVENRPGAAGNIATEAAARSEPDGYTILLAPLSGAVNESLYKNFKYRFEDSFEPVASLAETSLVLLVHPTFEAQTIPQFIALAKSKPGEVLYASAGRGTATHLAAELFNHVAGTKTTPVHYKGGGETIKDLLSGHVKVMFSTIPPVLGFVQNGQLKGLATTASKRADVLPNLPTVAEAGLPGYDVRLWFGLTVPKGTPAPVIARLADATKLALAAEDTKKQLALQGYAPLPGGPKEFGDLYRAETAKWAKIVESGAIGN